MIAVRPYLSRIAGVCGALALAMTVVPACAQSVSANGVGSLSERVVVPGYVPASVVSTAVTSNAGSNDIFAARPCRSQARFAALGMPLPHVAQRISDNEAVTIVAIGSSSTAGAGASAPLYSYPSQLALDLRKRLPHATFAVLNRGVNGEVIPDMLARLEASVLAQNPDLVIWQLGTNTVVRDEDVLSLAGAVRDGIRRIKARGADVILVDPQFAPRVIEKPAAQVMVDMIARVAHEEHAALFRRYATMKNWHVAESRPFEEFITPDGLHLNDWGYSCFAHLLGDGIVDAMRLHRAAQVRDGDETVER